MVPRRHRNGRAPLPSPVAACERTARTLWWPTCPRGAVPAPRPAHGGRRPRLQREGCARLGSPLYARLLAGLAADHGAGGLTAELLEGRSARPVHDALALRLLGAVHRIVLDGRAPELAQFYPSAGGLAAGDPTPAFLAAVATHRREVEDGLARGVQTNEVGRAAVLVPGFALVARRTGLPLRLREVGSSAGLLLRWERYRYVAGAVEIGDPASPLVFDDVWIDGPPDLSRPAGRRRPSRVRRRADRRHRARTDASR